MLNLIILILEEYSFIKQITISVIFKECKDINSLFFFK